MALIKCPECGSEIEENSKHCDNCGCSFQNKENNCQEESKNLVEKSIEENEAKEINNEQTPMDVSSEKDGKRKNNIKKIVSVSGIIFIILVIGIFATSNSRNYSRAKKLYNEGRYEESMKLFSKLDDYEDSKEMYDKALYQYKISKDKVAPELKSVPDEITIKQEDYEFDLKRWIDENISITDNVSGDNVSYNLDDGGLNVDVPGEYTIKISAKDEAKNVAEAEFKIIVEELSKTYDAYVEATTLTVYDLKKDSLGGYQYKGLAIVDEDEKWIRSSLNKKGSVNQGALYRSLAKGIEGFGFGKSFYGIWGKDIVPLLFGFEKKDSWDEMKPYIDSVSDFIVTDRRLKSIMGKLSTLSCVEGTIDTNSGKYDFTITDLTKASEELGITETALGYILAELDEYGDGGSFDGNSYTCSMVNTSNY